MISTIKQGRMKSNLMINYEEKKNLINTCIPRNKSYMKKAALVDIPKSPRVRYD